MIKKLIELLRGEERPPKELPCGCGGPHRCDGGGGQLIQLATLVWALSQLVDAAGKFVT